MRKSRRIQGPAALLLSGLLGLATQFAAAQAVQQEQSRGQFEAVASTQELLTQMVRKSSVIFAGGVYSVQSPQDKPGVVEIYLRVDQSVRGVDTGKGFILRLPQGEGQSFHSGDHFFLLLGPADASGISQPVGGSLGILPVDTKFNVDLSRLHALVQRAGGSKAGPGDSGSPGKTNDATGKQGQDADRKTTDAGAGRETGGDQAISTDAENQMAELEQPTVSFLAMLRDLFVLSAQQNPRAPTKP